METHSTFLKDIRVIEENNTVEEVIIKIRIFAVLSSLLSEFHENFSFGSAFLRPLCNGVTLTVTNQF